MAKKADMANKASMASKANKVDKANKGSKAVTKQTIISILKIFLHKEILWNSSK